MADWNDPAASSKLEDIKALMAWSKQRGIRLDDPEFFDFEPVSFIPRTVEPSLEELGVSMLLPAVKLFDQHRAIARYLGMVMVPVAIFNPDPGKPPVGEIVRVDGQPMEESDYLAVVEALAGRGSLGEQYKLQFLGDDADAPQV